jgi:Holliday junction resolvase
MTPEAKVKRKVTDLLKRLGIYYFCPLTGGYGRSGVPDIICCVNGRFVAIECKAGDNTLTALQQSQIDKIKAAKGDALVIYGFAGVLKNNLQYLEWHLQRRLNDGI